MWNAIEKILVILLGKIVGLLCGIGVILHHVLVNLASGGRVLLAGGAIVVEGGGRHDVFLRVATRRSGIGWSSRRKQIGLDASEGERQRKRRRN